MVNVDNVASEIGLRGLYLLQIILPPACLAQGADEHALSKHMPFRGLEHSVSIGARSQAQRASCVRVFHHQEERLRARRQLPPFGRG